MFYYDKRLKNGLRRLTMTVTDPLVGRSSSLALQVFIIIKVLIIKGIKVIIKKGIIIIKLIIIIIILIIKFIVFLRIKCCIIIITIFVSDSLPNTKTQTNHNFPHNHQTGNMINC